MRSEEEIRKAIESDKEWVISNAGELEVCVSVQVSSTIAALKWVLEDKEE